MVGWRWSLLACRWPDAPGPAQAMPPRLIPLALHPTLHPRRAISPSNRSHMAATLILAFRSATSRFVATATSWTQRRTRLLTQLTHRSPYRPYRGQTHASISDRYDYASSSAGCAITRATVAARIVFTMPRWKPKGKPDPFLVFEWNRFIEALWIHERGHALRALAAKRDVERTLRNLVSPTCEELRASAETATDQIISKLRARDRVYDRKTDHGATQGASIG
jgi:predicted secreted Zn-dependent protease